MTDYQTQTLREFIEEVESQFDYLNKYQIAMLIINIEIAYHMGGRDSLKKMREDK